jgi:hypothetical protein
MNQWLYRTGGVALVAALSLSPLGAQDTKTPTIKQVMKKLNAGPNSMTANLGKDLDEDRPAWDDIKKETKEFVTFAEALGKNKPPKGDADHWRKITKEYLETAKALATAADKEDKKAAKSAHAKLSAPGTCKACHSEHRKMDK